MAFCQNCGGELADGAKFCTNCGAPQVAHMQYDQTAQTGSTPDKEPSLFTDPNAGQPQQSAAGSYSSYTSGPAGAGTGADTSASYTSGGPASDGGFGSSYDTPPVSGGYTSSFNTDNPVPGMGFVEAVKTCFSKYATFSGRARRSEYWYFVLFNFLAALVLGIIGNIIFGAPQDGGNNMLQSLFSLAVLVPGLAVSCRRLHDIGKSGWWMLIALIPLVGGIILLIWEIKDSEPGANIYGMSPKYPMR